MRYLPNTAQNQRAMLETIGVRGIEDLLVRIPAKARLSRPLALPSALAESELVRHLRALAARNADAESAVCFLGGGAYDHYVPSPINHLILRGEFFTAYTPYQPEASQGTLRTIYEYQTMIAELTGMDVANASIYDGASSLAEAALMAHAVTSRTEIVLGGGVNPLYRRVVETYVDGAGLRLREGPTPEGVLDLDAVRRVVGGKTAALVVQSPTFYGCLEDVAAAAEIAHAAVRAPTSWWARARASACRSRSAVPTSACSRPSRSSCGACRAGWSAPRWTSTARAASPSRCRRASSTSAAPRRRPTSAPTSRCAR